MVRVPRDLGVLETGVASFECELSRPSVEVKWLKVRVRPDPLQHCPPASSSLLCPLATALSAGAAGRGGRGKAAGCCLLAPLSTRFPGQDGQELRPGPNCRIYSAGRRRVLQLSRCELADAGTYTCDAGDCWASAMLHVQGTAAPPPGDMHTPKPCATHTLSPLTALAPCPSPAERQVHIVQDLQDARVREGDNAVFTCEVSHGDVKGEWFRDGEKIKTSGTVKIRQEGGGAGGPTPSSGLGGGEFKRGEFVWTKGEIRASRLPWVPITVPLSRPLLPQGPGTSCCSAACTLRTRDSSASQPGWLSRRPACGWKVPARGARAGWAPAPGLARGVPAGARSPHDADGSPHTPALPIRIVKPLRDKTVLARHKATLECTVSHARGRVRWLRGDTEIFAGDKYEICNLDCYRTLIIHRVGPEDEDSYTCDAFDDRSTARLLVEGEVAPGGAPLGAGGAAMPRRGGTPGALSPRPTACKGLIAGVGGAGWIWDQESVSPSAGTPLSGAPPALGMLQLSLTPIVPAGS